MNAKEEGKKKVKKMIGEPVEENDSFYNQALSNSGSIDNPQQYVKMGEIIETSNPEHYNLLGIGSCLAIFMYDLKNHKYLLAHTLLPTESAVQAESARKYAKKYLPGKFTDQAIENMYRRLLANGSNQRDIKVKLIGGAQIYKIVFNIGANNIEMAHKKLRELNLDLISEDVGGEIGRSVLKFGAEGEVVIRKEGKIYKI